MLIVEIVFFVSVFSIIYTYALYPLILLITSSAVQSLRDGLHIIGKTERRASSNDSVPNIGVIIAAFNEEKCIRERIKNLIEQDYDSQKLAFYIGSDGSDDRTADILNSIDAPNLHFFDFKERRGKVSVLNDLVELAEEEILVFSDANTMFEPDAISKLARHFVDPDIGAAVGELVLYDPIKQGNQDSAYWKYERLLKFFESRINGLLGANGAIYAIRRSLYQPLNTSTLVDDFTIVMNICRRNKKAHYDPEAIAHEEIAQSVDAEFVRRVRIGAGNYQALIDCAYFINPLRGSRAFTFISHKVFRWLVPHFMISALLSNVLLINHNTLYTWLLACQVALYGSVMLVHLGRNRWQAPAVMQLAYLLVSMNIALGLGFIRFVKGQKSGTWKRTDR